MKFGYFIEECEEIHEVVEKNFVYIHVNYTSKKDEKSQIANQRLANAGRFGFLKFFQGWTPEAVTTL